MSEHPTPTAVDQAPAGTGGPGLHWWWYAVALVSYIALGLVFRTAILNWIVGPLYPLVVLYLLPLAVRRLRSGHATS